MITQMEVSLGDRSYPIYIGRGVVKLAHEIFALETSKKRKIAAVVDKNVFSFHEEKLRTVLSDCKNFYLNGGESTKCFSKLEELLDNFAEVSLDRKSAVVAVGGGVIGDLAGFAASTYMRGVHFYQIPTTLLAMVDSSVGGKTGINISAGKNLVGAFHQPQAVFADTEFLDSLPAREFSAGVAEAIKCGLLGDAEFFCELESQKYALNPSHEYLPTTILKSCQLKAKIVSEDERETSSEGGRALLNLGHTFGHAIEKCAGYGRYLHGEAVAIGTVMAARLSERMCGFNPSSTERIIELFKKNSLPVSLQENIPAQELLNAMFKDKKAISGELRFVLLEEIGKACTMKVSAEDVLKSLSK